MAYLILCFSVGFLCAGLLALLVVPFVATKKGMIVSCD